jgi:hypothetical protein
MPRRLLSILAVWLLLVVEGGVAGRCLGGPFTPGDLVVVRVDGGGANLSAATVQVYLDEFNPTTGALVQSVAMPVTPSGANRAFTLTGTVGEGYLTRSIDGRYLTLAGYDADIGVSAASQSPTGLDGSVDRVVARVDGNASINTSTVLTNAYGAGSVRSAATVDGSHYWTSGTSGAGANANTGGVYIIDQGATNGTRLSSTLNDTQNIAIFNNQLYVSSGSGNNAAVNTVGTGLPTTSGQTISPFILTTANTGTGATPYSFVVFDLNNDGIPDRVYVADDRINGSGGLQKWTSTNGTDWTLADTFHPNSSTGLRGLTGQVVNGNPVLYATTSVSGTPGGAGNELMSFTDDGSNSSFVALAAAANMTAFRGVAFAPAVPEPGSLALAGLGVVALTLMIGMRRTNDSGVLHGKGH